LKYCSVAAVFRVAAVADIIAKLDEGRDINKGGARDLGCSCSVIVIKALYNVDISTYHQRAVKGGATPSMATRTTENGWLRSTMGRPVV
jgi:hypothetical protein